MWCIMKTEIAINIPIDDIILYQKIEQIVFYEFPRLPNTRLNAAIISQTLPRLKRICYEKIGRCSELYTRAEK